MKGEIRRALHTQRNSHIGYLSDKICVDCLWITKRTNRCFAFAFPGWIGSVSSGRVVVRRTSVCCRSAFVDYASFEYGQHVVCVRCSDFRALSSETRCDVWLRVRRGCIWFSSAIGVFERLLSERLWRDHEEMIKSCYAYLLISSNHIIKNSFKHYL